MIGLKEKFEIQDYDNSGYRLEAQQVWALNYVVELQKLKGLKLFDIKNQCFCLWFHNTIELEKRKGLK